VCENCRFVIDIIAGCLVLLGAGIMSFEVLEDIRKELPELRLLYKELVRNSYLRETFF
jgi:hypothetical protein